MSKRSKINSSKKKRGKTEFYKKQSVLRTEISESQNDNGKVESQCLLEVLSAQKNTFIEGESSKAISPTTADKPLEKEELILDSIEEEKNNKTIPLQPLQDITHNHFFYDMPKNQNFLPLNHQKIEQNKSVGVFLLMIMGLAFVCFFLVKENEKNHKKSNISTIVEYNKPDATKLTCTLEEELEDGVTGLSKSIYIFRDDTLIQVIDEESVIFNDNSLKYYPYYEKGVKEELKDSDLLYDNTILEMKQDNYSVGLLYSIDLTANPNNPNNSLQLLGTTYDEAKESFEGEGYTCK